MDTQISVFCSFVETEVARHKILMSYYPDTMENFELEIGGRLLEEPIFVLRFFNGCLKFGQHDY